MTGPTTQPKQNVRAYNTTKPKCHDLQHNQNKMSGPTTQPKQNARTYNTTKSNKMTGPTTQPGIVNRKQNKKLVGPNNNFSRSTQGMNCRRAHIKFSVNQVRTSTSHGWSQPSEPEQPCGSKNYSGPESSPTNQLTPLAQKRRAPYRSQSFWAHK